LQSGISKEIEIHVDGDFIEIEAMIDEVVLMRYLKAFGEVDETQKKKGMPPPGWAN
jgi:hypothetical protein